MAKLFVYEFVFRTAEGTPSRVHTVRSANWREATKAILRHNTRDEVIAFQLADSQVSGSRGAKAAKDAVEEHPVMPTITSLASEPD